MVVSKKYAHTSGTLYVRTCGTKGNKKQQIATKLCDVPFVCHISADMCADIGASKTQKYPPLAFQRSLLHFRASNERNRSSTRQKFLPVAQFKVEPIFDNFHLKLSSGDKKSWRVEINTPNMWKSFFNF